MTLPPAIEIARRATLHPIGDIAAQMGIGPELLEPYGAHVAKVSLDAIGALAGRPRARYVVVTAVTPTPLGEGKTTTTVGLGQALACIGRQATVAIRQASMGPTFGIKGGAAGGGYSQVVPFENLNLHLTGDLHTVTAANNLLAAMVDNHLYNQNALGIDPHRITWKRVVDVNDRSLRNIVSGLGAKEDGIPRETGFDITAASEVMAVLALARDLRDFRDRMGRIVVGYTAACAPVTAEERRAAGAMTVIMRDAIKPNLLQTLENTPVLVHAGPFGNIADGNSSVVADLIGIHAGEYFVTEAGFGPDMGAERFFNIKCRISGLVPDAAVVVTTVRAMKLHSGRHRVVRAAPCRARCSKRTRQRWSSAWPTSWLIWPSSGSMASRPSSPSTRSKATSRPSTPPSARLPSPWACVPRSHPLREGWQGCGRAGRAGGRGHRESRFHAVPGGRNAAGEGRSHRHRGLRGGRCRLPAAGRTAARHLRAGRFRFAARASPRPTSPFRRIPRGWVLPGAGACSSARPGPTSGPGSSISSAATCAPCPGSRTAPWPSGSTSTTTATW